MIIMALFALKISSNYENLLFERVIKISIPEYNSNYVVREKDILNLLNATYLLLNPRKQFFGGKEWLSFRDTALRSSDIQMLDGGACGTHSHVLAKLLDQINVPVRIAQMKCGDHYGCHIVVEAQLNNNWVVLDPLFNLSFRKESGKLASFHDVQSDWSYYKNQLPKDYGASMKYDGVRYTNWEKIPFIMPLIKGLLDYFLPNEADFISIRVWVLNLYLTYFYIILAIFPCIIGVTYISYKKSDFN